MSLDRASQASVISVQLMNLNRSFVIGVGSVDDKVIDFLNALKIKKTQL